MSIEESIEIEDNLSFNNNVDAYYHAQVSQWLKELVKLRQENEKLKHIETAYRYIQWELDEAKEKAKLLKVN